MHRFFLFKQRHKVRVFHKFKSGFEFYEGWVSPEVLPEECLRSHSCIGGVSFRKWWRILLVFVPVLLWFQWCCVRVWGLDCGPWGSPPGFRSADCCVLDQRIVAREWICYSYHYYCLNQAQMSQSDRLPVLATCKLISFISDNFLPPVWHAGVIQNRSDLTRDYPDPADVSTPPRRSWGH